MPNYKHWIERANIDYFTAFIRAWIPFNAWYKDKYPTLDSDRAVINQLKRDSPVRNHIKQLIENSGEENHAFRSMIGALHHALLNAQIENAPEGIINFESIVVETNRENQINHTFKNITYFVKRTDRQTPGDVENILVIAKDKNGDAFFKLEQTTWDYEGLIKSKSTRANPLTGFDSCLSEPQKRIIVDIYKNLNPRRPVCLILQEDAKQDGSNRPLNYLDMGGAAFIKDSDLICKGMLEALYLLRNKLFHGEVTPNEGSQEVYRHSYFILMAALRKLQ